MLTTDLPGFTARPKSGSAAAYDTSAVSVLVAVYNWLSWLEDGMHSLTVQTLAGVPTVAGE